MPFTGSGGTTPFTSTKVLRSPGVLVINPTSITAPYGGTTIGRTAGGASLKENRFMIALISYDEQGAEPYNDFWAGQGEIILTCTLTEWSNDALELAFPLLTTVGVAERYVNFPGSAAPSTLEGEHVSVLWAPKDEITDKAIFLPAALPVLHSEEETFSLRLLRETDFQIKFKARRKASLTDAFERGLIGKPSDLDGLTGIP